MSVVGFCWPDHTAPRPLKHAFAASCLERGIVRHCPYTHTHIAKSLGELSRVERQSLAASLQAGVVVDMYRKR